MIGWAGTTGFSEKWVWDGAVERYALDADMASRLKAANPEAFRNILKRFLEAKGRGLWSPDDAVVERLQELYADVEDEIEGVV
jgi:magnesium chelatase subunit H